MHAKTGTFDFRREQIVFRYVSLATFTEMSVTLTRIKMTKDSLKSSGVK